VLLGGWAAERRANALRIEAPPSPPNGGLSLSVVEQDGRRIADFREPGLGWEWTLELRGAEAPGEVTLEWTSEALPAGLRLRLEDERDGWGQDLTPGRSVTLAGTAEPRRLRLRASFDAQVPDRAEAGSPIAYPNPFRGGTGIRLRLARTEVVSAAIFDAQGRRVRDLGRRELGPGEHVLVWDGSDGQGRAAPPGLYFARTEIGAERHTVRTLRLR
jgi:hypothetical protein